MKTDARVRYTKRVIRTVFLQLLQEKPISKITVKEICELAEINRGTFYKHYSDPYDLLTKTEADILEDFRSRLGQMEAKSIQQGVVSILQALKENYAVYGALIASGVDQGFPIRLATLCYHFIVPRLNTASKLQLDESQKAMCFSYFAGGTSGIIQYWLQTGMCDPPEKVAAMIESLNSTLLDNMMK